MNQCSITTASLLLAVSLLGSSLHAVEYSSQSELRVTTQYDDNARLSYDDPINLFGYGVRPMTDWQAREEHWDVRAAVDLRFNKYDLSEWNSDDQYLTLAGNYNTERQNFGINASAIKDSTRTSEYDTSGQIGFSAERRERLTITPQWTYLLTDRNRLSLQVSANNTEYDGVDYTDYKYLSGQTGWTYVFDEYSQFTFNVTYSNYKPDYRGPFAIGLSGYPIFYGKALNREKSLGYTLGGEYSFTEKLSINGSIGTTKSDSTYTLVEIPNGPIDCQFYETFIQPLAACNTEGYQSSNITGNISLNYSGERSSLNLGTSLQNQPTSYGYVMQYYRVNIDWSYRVSSKAKLTVDLSGGKNEAIDEELASADQRNSNRDFANTTIRYSYRFLENWYVSATAKYHWQAYEREPGHASGSGAMLGLVYRPTKHYW